jgi:catechol 2,3-dioxygenase-like lactoylglutathione lyase family enzyme
VTDAAGHCSFCGCTSGPFAKVEGLFTVWMRDVSRAQAFYEALGWHLDGGVDDEADHVAFFQAGGLIVALWDRGKLARDSGVTDMGGGHGPDPHNTRSAPRLRQASARRASSDTWWV